jgi:glycosyltransferase involved in cell wall biosynthesis
LRVLLLHNRYRAEGGEERVVRNIASLIERRGHTVELMERSSSEASRGRAGRALLRGGEEPEEVGRAVRRLRADVVHAHNLHPLFGWRALAAARAAGARTILHLHNFRLFCAIAVAYRAGAPCYRCRGGNTAPGVVWRCRGSLTEAAIYAMGLHNQQPHLFEHADRFVVLSEAHGARLKELGLPANHTHAVPNFIPDGTFTAATRANQGEYALVVGRLVEEKGFDTAIAAAQAAGVPLVVAGVGPDEKRLRKLARSGDVRFAGWLAEDQLAQARARAAVVLVPSRCEEACPYAVLDSLAAGLPVLVSDRGGLPELVESESVLPAESAEAWAVVLAKLWADRARRRTAGQRALMTARERFGENLYYRRLMRVYSGS